MMDLMNKIGVKVTPHIVEFCDADSNVVHQMNISIRNFSKSSKNIVLSGPKTEKFKVLCKESQKTIAPGLELTAVVEYYNKTDEDWNDAMTVHADGIAIEVPLKAYAPKPVLSVKGSIDFGILVADGKVIRKEIAILNHGMINGTFNIEYNGNLPLNILPRQGSVKAGYSQPIRIEFTSKTLGKVDEVINITLENEGVTKIPVKAEVVKTSLQLLATDGSTKLECIKFGPTYYETDIIKSSILYNCSPEPINFVVILEETGEGQELGVDLTKTASAILGPERPFATGSNPDLTSLITAIPCQGKLEAYAKTVLHFKFSPRAPAMITGWKTMERCRIPPRKDYALFVHIDTVENITYRDESLSNVAQQDSRVELAVTGTALPVRVSFLPSESIDFGECIAGQSVDQPCFLRNDSTFLPINFRTQKIAHFQPSLTNGKIERNQSLPITLSFRPNQIGNFQPIFDVELLGDVFQDIDELSNTVRFKQEVIWRLPVSCTGISPSIPGVSRTRYQRRIGALSTDSAITQDLDVKRSLVTETSMRVLTSKDTRLQSSSTLFPFKKDCKIANEKVKKTVQTASLNDLAASLRPSNTKEKVVTEFTKTERYSYIDPDYAWTESEERERQSHRQKYKDYIDSNRKKKVEFSKRLKDATVNNAVDLGMKPGHGLSPPKLRVSDVREHDVPHRPSTCKEETILSTKLLEKNLVQSVEKQVSEGLKAVPTTVKERQDCRKELSPQELYQINVKPKVIEFGEVCASSVVTKEITISNNLSSFISFNVLVDCRELRQTSPLSQVVPPKSNAQLGFVFESNAHGVFERSVSYSINDVHKGHLIVSANVVSVALSLSTSELTLSPTSGMPAEAGMRKTLTIYNKRNMAAEFSWTPILGKDGTAFSVRPAKGIVNPYSNLDSEVVFYPSFSAPLSGQFLLHVENGNQCQIQCAAELGPTSCSFVERRIMFGALPLNLVTTRKAHLKNTSLNHAYFKVVDPSPIPGMSIFPKEGVVPVGGKTELKISLQPELIQKFDSMVEVNIRGWKTISLRMGGHVEAPSVSINLDSFSFGGVYCGAKASIPFVMTNMTRSPAHLKFDLNDFTDFSLKLPDREHQQCCRDVGGGYFHVMLKGQQEKNAFLEFAPCEDLKGFMRTASFVVLEVASYNFALQASINDTKAVSRPSTPHAACVSPNRSQNGLRAMKNGPGEEVKEQFTPCRRVRATALRPPLQISHEDLTFKLPSGYFDLGLASNAGPIQGVMFVNNSDSPVTFAFYLSANETHVDDGTFRLLHQTGLVFAAEEGKTKGLTAPVLLESGETFQLGVLFCPGKPGLFKAKVPIVLNDNTRQYYRTLNLTGEVEAPLIQFEPESIQLTPVPLRTDISAEFQIIAKGYRRSVELKYRIPEAELEDGSTLAVIKLDFPDGLIIKACCAEAGEIEPFLLPCKLTFSSPQPVAVTTAITFLIAGESYHLPIAAVADNCLLTCYSFLNTHQSDFHIICEENQEMELRKQVKKGNGVDREAERIPCLSPIRPPSNMSTSATSTSFGLTMSSFQESSNTCTSSSYRSSPQNPDEEEVGALSPYWFEPEDIFPESETDEGKYLKEVMKVVQRWVSTQSWANGYTPLSLPYSLRSSLTSEYDDCSPRTGSWDREGKKESRTIFDIVAHFCGKSVPGIPINPTLSDDDRERTKQILWMFSTLLTFLRCQGALLSTIKSEHLLDSQDYNRLGEVIEHTTMNSEEERKSGFSTLEREREMYELLSRRAWTNLILQVIKVLVLGKIVPSSYKKMPLPERCAPLPPVNSDPHSSNVYSVNERIILTWVNHHYMEQRNSPMWNYSTEGTPPSARWIVNFDNDFLDGLVFASLLAAHAPFLIKAHFHSLYTRPNTAEQCLHNALKVVEAVRFLGMDYDILATDITEPNSVGTLLFCIYLYRRLPQYLTKNTIEFSGPLHATVTKYVRLQNPSTKPLTYQVILSGDFASDFSVPHGNSVKVPPKGQVQLSVQYKGRFLHQCTATLILVGRRQGAPVGCTLVFNLLAEVNKIIPLGTIKCENPCYELKHLNLDVCNPFHEGGEFRIVLVESKLPSLPSKAANVHYRTQKNFKAVEAKTDHGKKTSHRRKAQGDHLPQQQEPREDPDAAEPFLSSFWCPLKSIYLNPKVSCSIDIQFLPLHMGPRQCSVLFLHAEIGEFLYSVEAEATLPRPSFLPFSQNYIGPRVSSALMAERSQGAITADDRIIYWQCEEGDSIKEELCLPVLNTNKENALVLVSQQRMSENELKRRMLTGFISNATILAAIKSLNLGDNQVTTPAEAIVGAPEKTINLSVECDSRYFKSVPSISIQVAVDTKSAVETVSLPIEFTPEEQGHYPCRIILRSPNDVRVYHLLCIVSPRGSKAKLYFSSRTNESVVQEIPFVNYSDQEWMMIAKIEGDGFHGPSEFIAGAKQTFQYPLSFAPLYEGEVQGKITFINSHTLTETVFGLYGDAQMPAALDRIVLTCQARNMITYEVELKNVMRKKMVFLAFCDLDIVSGPEMAVVLPSRSVNYPITVSPWKRGVFKGVLSFLSDDTLNKLQLRDSSDSDSDNDEVSSTLLPVKKLSTLENTERSKSYRLWYSIEVHSTPTPPEKTIDVVCSVYSSCEIEVVITNPTGEVLVLDVVLEGTHLEGPSGTSLEPLSSNIYKAKFSPTKAGESRGSVIFQSPVVGEFWYALNLVSKPPDPVNLPPVQCPLGRSTYQKIELENPSEKDVEFTVQCSNCECFHVEQHGGKVFVPKKTCVEVPLTFSPNALGAAEHTATITFASKQFGDLIYYASGVGTAPIPSEDHTIKSRLGRSSSLILPFQNPFNEDVIADVSLTELPVSRAGHLRTVGEENSPATSSFSLLLRQATDIRLGPRTILDLPISFAPSTMVLQKATCVVTLTKINVPSTSEFHRTVSKTNDTKWVYNVKGVPEAAPVKDSRAPLLQCKARERCEERIEVSFTGLEPTCSPDEFAYLRALSPLLGNLTPTSDQETHCDYNILHENITFEFEYPDNDAQACLQRTLGISLQKKLRHKISGAVLLAFNVVFSPHKAFECLIYLCITAASGGTWRFPLRFRATDPPPDDMIEIEAAGINKASQVGFRLSSISSHPIPFEAYFASGSNKCFTITPEEGELMPAEENGTLFKVTYCPLQYGKIHCARLVIQTSDMQWNYEIRGVLPGYRTASKKDKSIPPFLEDENCQAKPRKKNFVRENLRLSSTAVSSPVKASRKNFHRNDMGLR